jgi:hypothetical protein
MYNLKSYCGKLFGQYNNNIKKITKESTDIVFELIKKPNNELFFAKKFYIGKFYFILYNYNGNKIWCPIFLIDDRYDPINQKRILYAINIDYLPYAYRIIFFDILFNMFNKTIEYNRSDSINMEKSLNVDFELIYKLLKKNGEYDYSITAFNFEKIDQIKKYFISTNFVNRFLFIDTKIVNIKNMRDLLIVMNDLNIKNRLSNIIELFEKIKEDLNINEQKKYYKQLKSIESMYKLIENNKI